jgi:predicted ATPase with chaperone activity
MLSGVSFYPSVRTRNLFDCGYPCPCGYSGDSVKPCTCSASTVTKYQKRISGPLLDRIDIHTSSPSFRGSKSRAWIMTSFPATGWVNHLRSSGHGWKPPASASANALAERTSLAPCWNRDYRNADMRVAEVRKFCPVLRGCKRITPQILF